MRQQDNKLKSVCLLAVPGTWSTQLAKAKRSRGKNQKQDCAGTLAISDLYNSSGLACLLFYYYLFI